MDRLAEAFGAYILEPGFPLEVVEIARDSISFNDSSGIRIST